MLTEVIMKKLIEDIDFSKYSKDIEKALDEYFKSELFMEDFQEALSDEGLSSLIGEFIAKGYIIALKQSKIDISITPKPAKK